MNHDNPKTFDMVAMGWSAEDPFGYSSSICELFCSKSQSNYSGFGTAALVCGRLVATTNYAAGFH